MTNTCVWRVAEPPGYWHEHVCGRKTKGERDGFPLCGTHLNAWDRHPLSAKAHSVPKRTAEPPSASEDS